VKYLCLCYADERVLSALGQNGVDALRREAHVYLETLRESGRLLAVERLQSVRMAATVRVRNGRVYATDGPFAETKEQLGGFFLIEARDLNDAIQVATRWPPARLGSVEVRPVAGLGDSGADGDFERGSRSATAER